jgi:hypothetical protein
MRMTWPQLDIGSAFLILSVVAGAGAAALLLYETARARSHRARYLDPTSPIQLYSENGGNGREPNLLDRVNLLNRNLIQCPSCFNIDYANARFCIRCGMPMQSQVELPRSTIGDVEARYLVRDESNQMLGLSIRLDPETRLGVIVGLQRRQHPQSVNENGN